MVVNMIDVDLDKMVATEQAYLEQAKIMHQKALASFMTAGFAKDLEPIINWMQLVNNHLAVLSEVHNANS